jgi:hypothetical protein
MMTVTGGSTDVTTYFSLRLAADGTEATGLTITNFDLQYVRSGATPAAKVDATALAATDSAHADNKAIEIDATDQPGLYRVDWPDAAFAAGVKEVILTVKCATAFTEHLRVMIDAPVNVTTLGGSATPVTNMNTVFNTDFAANYNTTNDGWVVKLGNYAQGGASATLTLGATTIDTITSSTWTVGNFIVTNNFSITTMLVTTNNIAWSAAWDAEVQSEAQDAITASSLPTAVQVWAAATRTLTALDEDTTTLDLDTTITAAVPTAAQIATAVLTTAMTEAYRTAGGTATLAQAVYELIAHMGDSVISGTTKTLRKLDGTTAKTFTLDSASTPASITEAT